MPLPTGVTLRAITPKDRPFMAKLYSVGRQAELASFPFDDQQKALFLKCQFEAQYQQYFLNHDCQRYRLLESNGAPIGRWLTRENSHGFQVVDIALLPTHQRLGIGSALLRKLQTEAMALGKSIQLQVAPLNAAVRLYERLGFQHQASTDGFYQFMSWKPPIAQNSLGNQDHNGL